MHAGHNFGDGTRVSQGPRLTVEAPATEGEPASFFLSSDVTTIGRSPENDVVLNDRTVSRHHALIEYRDDGYRIENLSPGNKILHNGREIQKARINEGDRLRVGKTVLVFRAGHPTTDSPAAGPSFIAVDAQDPNVLLDVDEESPRDLQRARANLASLYRAGQVVNACLSTDDLYQMTVNTILNEMAAVDCCSLHLLSSESNQLQCMASRSRDSASEPTGKSFSRALLDKVLNEMQAVLTYDAQDDGRFDSSMSITQLNIHSAMCVPLQVQRRLIGVVQAHTLDPKSPFDVHDLKLLTAFGMMAGSAIENARLYEALDAERARQEARARTMQVMVHEMKSPIGGARMMADVLRQGLAPKEKQQDFLNRIVRRLDNMLEWIKDTLEFSRLRAGEAAGEAERINLSARMPEVAQPYAEQAEARKIDFVVNAPEDPLIVVMRDRELHLILSNLLSNAVKYTQEGRVTVTLSVEDGMASMRVTDTGMGIPEKDIPKLFGEFFRASNARTSSVDGSGVGLASVKFIVERAGGTIELDTRENEGSTFTVKLPLASGRGNG